MPGLSRRTFLTRGSLALGVGGMAAAVPGLRSILASSPAQASESNGALTDAEAGAADLNGPLVAQVTNTRSGEISLYQGENQVVFNDPDLVSRLFRANTRQGR